MIKQSMALGPGMAHRERVALEEHEKEILLKASDILHDIGRHLKVEGYIDLASNLHTIAKDNTPIINDWWEHTE